MNLEQVAIRELQNKIEILSKTNEKLYADYDYLLKIHADVCTENQHLKVSREIAIEALRLHDFHRSQWVRPIVDLLND